MSVSAGAAIIVGLVILSAGLTWVAFANIIVGNFTVAIICLVNVAILAVVAGFAAAKAGAEADGHGDRKISTGAQKMPKRGLIPIAEGTEVASPVTKSVATISKATEDGQQGVAPDVTTATGSHEQAQGGIAHLIPAIPGEDGELDDMDEPEDMSEEPPTADEGPVPSGHGVDDEHETDDADEHGTDMVTDPDGDGTSPVDEAPQGEDQGEGACSEVEEGSPEPSGEEAMGDMGAGDDLVTPDEDAESDPSQQVDAVTVGE